MLGTGTNDTRVAIKHTQFAEELGCDGALLVTPYYNKGTERGVVCHYRSIAESTSLPLMLYNVPSRTGVNMSRATLENLAEVENIVAIKEASDSADRLVEIAAMGERLQLYAGNDTQLFTTLALGGKGVISVVSNVAPRLMNSIYESFKAGDILTARAGQGALLPLIKAMFIETNPAPVKHAMARLGFTSGEVRLPLYEVSGETKRANDIELSRYGLTIQKVEELASSSPMTAVAQTAVQDELPMENVASQEEPTLIVDAMFAEFWSEYPARRDGKPKNMAKYRRILLDSKNPKEEHERIMAGLRGWKSCRKWTKDDHAYVDSMSKFLNNRLWEVEPDNAGANNGNNTKCIVRRADNAYSSGGEISSAF
jgi:4-hydroxy-tetrahydrodipicolinate synthase